MKLQACVPCKHCSTATELETHGGQTVGQKLLLRLPGLGLCLPFGPAHAPTQPTIIRPCLPVISSLACGWNTPWVRAGLLGVSCQTSTSLPALVVRRHRPQYRLGSRRDHGVWGSFRAPSKSGHLLASNSVSPLVLASTSAAKVVPGRLTSDYGRSWRGRDDGRGKEAGGAIVGAACCAAQRQDHSRGSSMQRASPAPLHTLSRIHTLAGQHAPGCGQDGLVFVKHARRTAGRCVLVWYLRLLEEATLLVDCRLPRTA